jgi:hypothetical protein
MNKLTLALAVLAVPALAQAATVESLHRDSLAPGVAHYTAVVRVGGEPNAVLRMHRVVREIAPWIARPSAHGILLLHGDFATFESNFAPSLISGAATVDRDLSVYLAQQGIDVWGFDRRWTQATTDTSDLGGMTLAAEVEDVEFALAAARFARASDGSGGGPMILGGFSRGALLTYLTAEHETQLRHCDRNISAIAPIDIYVKIAPEDDALRQAACASADAEAAQLASGVVDADDTIFQALGYLAESDPADISPIFGPPLTNEQAMFFFTAQTWQLFAPTPNYHLIAGTDTGFRWSNETLVEDWLAASPAHQALVEIAQSDALYCGQNPPLADHLAAVTVPVFYLGAAGGFGDHGRYTLAQLGSRDVTTHIVRRLAPSDEASDYGHADLLYADDAPALAWAALLGWIRSH